MKTFFVFDVESIGLHGDGFAVGWVVIGEKGAIYEESYLACLSGAASGLQSSRDWVEKNIPFIKPTHSTPIAVRDAFWRIWGLWKASGAIMVSDCGWPVEARFLAKCVDDYPLAQREWDGPYPLHDLASILMATGKDPLATTERLPSELPIHNPLCDARQSARLLIAALAVGQPNRP